MSYAQTLDGRLAHFTAVHPQPVPAGRPLLVLLHCGGVVERLQLPVE